MQNWPQNRAYGQKLPFIWDWWRHIALCAPLKQDLSCRSGHHSGTILDLTVYWYCIPSSAYSSRHEPFITLLFYLKQAQKLPILNVSEADGNSESTVCRWELASYQFYIDHSNVNRDWYSCGENIKRSRTTFNLFDLWSFVSWNQTWYRNLKVQFLQMTIQNKTKKQTKRRPQWYLTEDIVCFFVLLLMNWYFK